MLSIIVIGICVIAMLMLAYEITIPIIMSVVSFLIALKLAPEAVHAYIEFFLVSENEVINIIWLGFCIGFILVVYTVFSTIIKYLKDCMYLGTLNFRIQRKCRRAMEYRNACLGMTATFLQDTDSAAEIRHEMLKLARLWEQLSVASVGTNDWIHSTHKKRISRDDYEILFDEAFETSTAIPYFNSAVDMIGNKDSFFEQYGYKY